MSLLVLNAGSSSLKFSAFEHKTLEEIASGLVDWKSGRERASLTVKTSAGTAEGPAAASDYATAVTLALESIAPRGRIRAVGHRVVHGGTRFREPVLIDAHVKEEIDRLSELAPLHNPPALQVIEAAQRAVADVPQVAVFDTAFFANLPPRAHVYPLPYSWYTDWGVRRFGFHGISHAYCASRAAELLQNPDLRLVICHLGNGCSATAVRGREPVATTMGFTPLEGLMMGTRAGSLDPGILLHLERRGRMSAEELDFSPESCCRSQRGLGHFRRLSRGRTGSGTRKCSCPPGDHPVCRPRSLGDRCSGGHAGRHRCARVHGRRGRKRAGPAGGSVSGTAMLGVATRYGPQSHLPR
jgi:acetate kinase